MESVVEPAGNASTILSAALQLPDIAMGSITILTTLFASIFSLVLASPKSCKPVPGSTGWPSLEAWQQLNHTVDGQLVSPPPPGAVCHPTNELFNNASCSELLENWTLSSWHAQNPITSDYNDDTCPPDPTANCSRDGYPAYTVNATKHEHVAAAVTFAQETGVRLVIKGTGHDFPGRSAGRGSLSIHTHYLRGIKVFHNDPRALKYGGVAAVKIAAGMQMRDLYGTLAKDNVTVVGGADMNVGVGGWTGGGGHSPISSLYGLGADNVLEMEVVTADGKIRTISEDCEPDLFWAMRGGGASTYAVMLSVTMRAHPSTYLTTYVFNFNTTASSEAFWNMTAAFHTQIPSLVDAGAMGYYWNIPNATLLFAGADPGAAPPGIDTTSIPTSQAGLLAGLLMFRSTVNTTAITQPLESFLAGLSLPSPVHVSSTTTPIPLDFNTFWSASQNAELVGSTNTRLGSWLLGRTALSRPIPELAAALAAANADQPLPQLGHLVAGPGVHEAANTPGGGNAVLPAWRTAYTHFVLPASWPAGAEDLVTDQLRDVRVKALREFEPESGAYVNEADPTTRDWKTAFWGTNYQRLAQVKERWDPKGVFWCLACVGSDDWEVTGGDGVGQAAERLCRRKA